MTAVRYGNIFEEPATAQVTGIGSQNGPPGGDGWQIVARLPQAQRPSGTGRYCVVVNGKIGNVQVSGGAPVRGVVQLCLGDTFGTKSPFYVINLPVTDSLPPLEAVPFQLMSLMTATLSDPTWGGTWNNDSGAELCLYARTFWNGDTPNYAVQFEVGDVKWLWLDSNRIASGDLRAEYYSGPEIALGTTPNTGLVLNTSVINGSSETWLHIANFAYSNRDVGRLAPSFQHGHTTTIGSFAGFVPKLGTNGRWGQQRAGANLIWGAAPQFPVIHQGGFWVATHGAGGSIQPAMRGWDRVAHVYPTLFWTYRYLGLKLDNLPDVLWRYEQTVDGAVGSIGAYPNFSQRWMTLERPASGLVTDASLLVHGIVQTLGRNAYGSGVSTTFNTTLGFPALYEQADFAQLEGAGSMQLIRRAFGASQVAMQYKAHFIGALGIPDGERELRDATILQLGLVRDPDREMVPIVPPSNPIVVVPGRESANVSSLSAPPIAPNAEVNVQIEGPARERIRGQTGYVRTWPVGTIIRRTFSAIWSPVSLSDADAVLAFLQANRLWKYTPLRGQAVAVLAMEPPEKQHLAGGGHRYSVQQQVAELIWTL